MRLSCIPDQTLGDAPTTARLSCDDKVATPPCVEGMTETGSATSGLQRRLCLCRRHPHLPNNKENMGPQTSTPPLLINTQDYAASRPSGRPQLQMMAATGA